MYPANNTCLYSILNKSISNTLTEDIEVELSIDSNIFDEQLIWDYFLYGCRPQLIGYADAGYLSNPHQDPSQTR